MAKVPNGEEKLPKISTGARTLQTDRETTDGTAMARSIKIRLHYKIRQNTRSSPQTYDTFNTYETTMMTMMTRPTDGKKNLRWSDNYNNTIHHPYYRGCCCCGREIVECWTAVMSFNPLPGHPLVCRLTRLSRLIASTCTTLAPVAPVSPTRPISPLAPSDPVHPVPPLCIQSFVIFIK